MESVPGFVATRSSNLKKSAGEKFETYHHVSYKAKLKTHPTSKEDKIESKADIDMKQLRYEVIKFGSLGLNNAAKQASSVALAIALGAKPPKNPYRNYKDILSCKSAEKTSTSKPIKIAQPPISSSKQHYYVVGKKVVPAKPKRIVGSCKKLLDNYGKAGQPKFKKGGRNKGGRRE